LYDVWVAFGATSPLRACVPSSRAGEGNARFWTVPPSGRMSQRSHGQRVLPRADQVLHESLAAYFAPMRSRKNDIQSLLRAESINVLTNAGGVRVNIDCLVPGQ
jgi:hypothetical protein